MSTDLALEHFQPSLSVRSGQVPPQRPLALELLSADGAAVPDGLVVGGHVHVATARRPELLSAPLARKRLGQVVDRVDVAGHIGSPLKSLGALVAFVLGVLVLGFAQKQRV